MLGGRRAARDAGLAPSTAGGPRLPPPPRPRCPPGITRGGPRRPPQHHLGGAATVLPPCSTWGGGGWTSLPPHAPPLHPWGSSLDHAAGLHPLGVAAGTCTPLCIPASGGQPGLRSPPASRISRGRGAHLFPARLVGPTAAGQAAPPGSAPQGELPAGRGSSTRRTSSKTAQQPQLVLWSIKATAQSLGLCQGPAMAQAGLAGPFPSPAQAPSPGPVAG